MNDPASMSPTRSPAPFVSVVICSFNRADDVARTLEGLTRLRYPRDQYEVIVVDDGSTDGTESVVRTYDVVYRRHETNRGIPRSRNTGLHAARGEVVAFLDDDCIPHEDWLSEIAACYRDPDVIAVGGAIEKRGGRSLTAHYLYDSGYGKPILFDIDQRRGLVGQFLAYLRIQLTLVDPSRFARLTEATELCGANMSFRRRKALEIGGYDEHMRVGEDTDLSIRLRRAHPGTRMLYQPRAVVSHRYPDSFRLHLRKAFRRGRFLLDFRRKFRRATPVHPFPLAWIFGNAAIGWLAPAWLPLSALVIAYALYFHWLVRFVVRPGWRYLVYPFLQLAIEICTMAGVFHALANDAFVPRAAPPLKRQA